MGNIPNTSLIILTFNNLDYTKDCIESIRDYTKEGTYEIIVVDNYSTDGTREWLKEQSDIITVLNHENLGFPKGCNIGIDVANKENDILLLNNDTILTPKWLENLSAALYSNEKIAAVGPVSNCVANQQQIDVTLNNKYEILSFAEKFNNTNPYLWEEKHLLIGYCFYIKRSILEEVGYLDELFTPGNYEDCDLSLRIIEKGYKMILCNDTFIYHAGSATFRNNPDIYSYFGDNRIKFNNKWGFDHKLIAELRFEIIELIDIPKESEIDVLEIGCGAGMNLLKIKYLYPNSNIYGIEDRPNIDKIAKQIVNLSTKKIEDYEFDFKENFFDYILINDNLHHVSNPELFLNEVSRCLKPGGHVLCIVQNILSVRNLLNIINGNFYMANRGEQYKNIFTLQDVIDLFSQVKLKLSTGKGQGQNLELQHIKLIELLKESEIITDDIHLKLLRYTLDFVK